MIEEQLLVFRERFAMPRKTVITHQDAQNYVVEEKIEDLYLLIDRFGYTKAVDSTSYSKIQEETLKEFPHIVRIKSNDKLCLFTAEGNMYQLKVSAIPRTRVKDKGTLIQTMTKIGSENILLYIPYDIMFDSQLLFVTRSGLIKQVSGVEFDTSRTMVAATKLDDGDIVVGITAMSAKEVLSGHMKVIILTEKKLSLGFPLEEVPELKKTGKGVKSITLEKKDQVLYGTVLNDKVETFSFDGKEYNAKKVRNRKRGAKGQNAAL